MVQTLKTADTAKLDVFGMLKDFTDLIFTKIWMQS